jgi:predicted phage baseplate assembly protein
MALVELWAYMGDILHYYIDRAAGEMFLDTAKQRESVLAIANLLDYTPNPRTPAHAQIALSCPQSAYPLDILAGTVFVAPAVDDLPAIYWTLDFDTSLQSYQGLSTGSFPSVVSASITEGVIIPGESLGLSNGRVSQRKPLYRKNVALDSVVVVVAEGPLSSGAPTPVPYAYTSRLVGSDHDAPVFTLEVSADGVTYVVFGNGVNGRVPLTNAEVLVSYRVCSGANGNIGTGRITRLNGAPINGLVVTPNDSPAGGGRDEESIESMRISIPKSFRTQDRAVSIKDYEDLCLRVPGVSKAKAFFDFNTNTVNIYPVEYQADYLTAGSTLTLSGSTNNNVESYFATRSLAGTSYLVQSITPLVGVNISATVNVRPDYVSTAVKVAVSTAINTLFTFDAVTFDQFLTLGDLYQVLQSVPGVSYCTVEVFDYSPGSTLQTALTLNGGVGLFHKGTVTLNVFGGITGNQGVL